MVVKVEFFHQDNCAMCLEMHRLLEKVLPKLDGIMFKETNISLQGGEERAQSLGIYSVPALTVDDEPVIIGRTNESEIIEVIQERLGD